MTVDTEKYVDFVREVTSNESVHYAALLTRMNNLELEDDCNIPPLITAAFGLTAEAGEFTEIVKKIVTNLNTSTVQNLYMLKSLFHFNGCFKTGSLRYAINISF